MADGCMCPNGHPMPEATTETCEECGAVVTYAAMYHLLRQADATLPPLFKVVLDELKARGWKLVNTVGAEDREPAIAPLYEDPDGNRYGSIEQAIVAQTFREIGEGP